MENHATSHPVTILTTATTARFPRFGFQTFLGTSFDLFQEYKIIGDSIKLPLGTAKRPVAKNCTEIIIICENEITILNRRMVKWMTEFKI